MEADKIIPLQEIVRTHEVNIAFIEALRESGFIHLLVIEKEEFVPAEELGLLEKMIRLHHELEINFEGVETISYLLLRMEKMQQEITELKNRLRLYE